MENVAKLLVVCVIALGIAAFPYELKILPKAYAEQDRSTQGQIETFANSKSLSEIKKYSDEEKKDAILRLIDILSNDKDGEVLRAYAKMKKNFNTPNEEKKDSTSLSNYIDNGVKFYTKGHPKSHGLNIEIKYPKDWTREEGNREHIVQKFEGESNYALCLLFIDQIANNYDKDIWLEFSENIDYVEDYIKSTALSPENIKVQITEYEGEPGNLIEYSNSGERAGFKVYMKNLQHQFYYKKYIIILNCSVATLDEKMTEDMYNESYQLFRLMGNDIILHDKYENGQGASKNMDNVSQDDINEISPSEELNEGELDSKPITCGEENKMMICRDEALQLYTGPVSLEVENVEFEGEAVNGLINGTIRVYHKPGVLAIEQSYKKGKVDGIEKTYNANGILINEIQTKDGQYDGLAKRYYDTG